MRTGTEGGIIWVMLGFKALAFVCFLARKVGHAGAPPPRKMNGPLELCPGSDKHTDSENIRNQETEVETNADILSISGNVSMGTCGPRVCSTRARAKLTSASLRVISLLSMRLVV
ncbi:hypothetical protein ABG768_004695 [Culter alburnus]|uniref:Secreted protein n=1 Tax=Culter alburnus TaxID=194366 RepID=A0AAW1ZXN3_CULAL